MSRYQRILLKISGEVLLGQGAHGIAHGIDGVALRGLCLRIGSLRDLGYQIALVVGGGNIFRGIQQKEGLHLERTPADQMGMLATMMNGIALSETLNGLGYPTTMMSALDCPDIAKKFQWKDALHVFDRGGILLFVGGTGHPYFTTDTAAALRGSEIGVDLFLKSTMHVDGIYDKDPRRYSDAKKFDVLTYTQVVEKRLGVMDLTAVTLCMVNKIPIRVFNINSPFEEALADEKHLGTLIRE